MKPMQSLLPLFAILLCACADTSYPRSELQIDDADGRRFVTGATSEQPNRQDHRDQKNQPLFLTFHVVVPPLILLL